MGCWVYMLLQRPSAHSQSLHHLRSYRLVEQPPFCSTLRVLRRKGMCGMQPVHIWLSRRQLLVEGLTATAVAAERSAHCCHWQAALCPIDGPGMVARWCFPGDLLSGQLL